MKKRELITYSIIIFLVSMTILITPAILPVLGVEGNTTTFTVSATISGGSPTITYVDAITGTPQEGGSKIINFYFNATHPNGVSYIPASGAQIKINQSGVTLLSTPTTGCRILATDGSTLNRYECNITVYYYTLPGSWTINASIVDTSTNWANNTGSIYTNNPVYGINVKPSISFTGNPGDLEAANENPQQVNNTGNMPFSQINLTAIALQSGANIIGAGNFTANTTDGAGAGHMLINNTPVTLTDSNISVNSSRNIFLYLNIPNGITNGTYTGQSAWTVTLS